MYIDYLHNHPEHVEIVSGWIYSEFVLDTDKNVKKLEQINSYYKNTKVTKFPITLIAVENSECVGTVSIYENDLKNQNLLTPWLASLYVCPLHRGKGIAANLIIKVQEIIKDLGFKTIYLRTEHTSEYYKSRGWEYVYKTHDEKGNETEIFKFEIDI